MKTKVRNVCLGLVGATSMACFLGSTTSFADEVDYTDSATSMVDIVVKEDANVNDEKVFKFESVPTGLSFQGTYAASGITMAGQTEGDNHNIVLKTDIEDAQSGNFKVTGNMTEVTRIRDQKSFAVDTFSIKFGEESVNVKDGTEAILDKSTIKEVDTTTSKFYDYIKGSDITSSTLTLATSADIQKGDVFRGTLEYTLSGTIDFA